MTLFPPLLVFAGQPPSPDAIDPRFEEICICVDSTIAAKVFGFEHQLRQASPCDLTRLAGMAAIDFSREGFIRLGIGKRFPLGTSIHAVIDPSSPEFWGIGADIRFQSNAKLFGKSAIEHLKSLWKERFGDGCFTHKRTELLAHDHDILPASKNFIAARHELRMLSESIALPHPESAASTATKRVL